MADTLDTIFSNAITNTQLIKTREALHSDYIPNHLPFRELQISSIGQVLAPLLHGSRPSNLLIYGKTGSGKTAVTRYVVSKLQHATKEREIKCYFVYSNTRLAGTEYRTLAEIAAEIGLKIPFTGLAVSEVLARLRQYIKEKAIHLVIILDEIDYLIRAFSDDLLYNITTPSDTIAPASVSIIGISNDLKFKEDLGARVLSRLSEEEIVFPPYAADQLKSILSERAQIALEPDSYTASSINLCAALSGSEHGDARRAVDLLRVAAEVADREGSQLLDDRHVRLALQKIDQDRVTEALTTLPLHAKLVLLAILHTSKDPRNCSSGTVYQEYSQICHSNSVDALTPRRVSGLLSELDTLGLISATLVNYGRYGRTKRINVHVDVLSVRQAFSTDEAISRLLFTLAP